ncbi:hypothetical protein RA166_10540 [Mycetohabitans endofungorum]|nr:MULTISPECIES: hypothetical protein [Burkholderiaceae]
MTALPWAVTTVALVALAVTLFIAGVGHRAARIGRANPCAG